MLGLVEDARDEGLDVTFDSYPYHYSSTRLLILVPQWAHDGGPERLKEVLRRPTARERLRKEMGPRAASLAGHVAHRTSSARKTTALRGVPSPRWRT